MLLGYSVTEVKLTISHVCNVAEFHDVSVKLTTKFNLKKMDLISKVA